MHVVDQDAISSFICQSWGCAVFSLQS